MAMYELLLRVDGPLEEYPSGVAMFINNIIILCLYRLPS